MSIEAARAHLRKWGRHEEILEFDSSSATVALAAAAAGVEPARIAKTLAFRNGEDVLLLITAGDARTDNAKFRTQFGDKPRMLDADEVLERTGHAVGGVCPFGVKEALPIWLDVSLQRFDRVYPACGSANSAISLTCEALFEISQASGWVDVCKNWQRGFMC